MNVYMQAMNYPVTRFEDVVIGGSDVVRTFKSITARELFRQFPEWHKDLWGGWLWVIRYTWNVQLNWV